MGTIHSGRRKKSIASKIWISIFSLIFFLTLLEVGLRIIGHLYTSSRVAPEKAISRIEGGYTILCLGDSFTFGGQVSYKDAYPTQLQEMLNARNPGKRFRVINGGVCEYNSTQVLKFLPGHIQSCNPDLIILLVGSSNRFNFAGYSFSARQKRISLRLKDALYSLKVYKMVKILRLNVKQRMLVSNLERNVKAEIPIIYRDRNERQKDLEFYNKALQLNPASKGILHTLAKIYHDIGEDHKALEMCSRALQLNPNSEPILNMLSEIYHDIGEDQKAMEMSTRLLQLNPNSVFPFRNMAKIYRDMNQYQKALEMCNRALQINPNSSFIYREMGKIYIKEGKYDLGVECFIKTVELDPEDEYSYYVITRAYELQSRYDSHDILESFQGMLKANPALKENSMFMDYLTFFSKKQKLDREIDKRLKDDLQEIARLCRRKGIKLMLQDYPSSFPTANKILRDIAAKYSLPFVRNHEVFNKLISKGRRETYLFDDDHCAPEGHRVMVENIYQVLISQDVIPE